MDRYLYIEEKRKVMYSSEYWHSDKFPRAVPSFCDEQEYGHYEPETAANLRTATRSASSQKGFVEIHIRKEIHRLVSPILDA